MVKLGLRRPSSMLRHRRGSDESYGMSIGESAHSDSTAPADFPSVVKPSAADGGGGRSSDHSRASVNSMISVDTVKASGGDFRKSFKATKKSSFLSKSFRSSFRKSKGGGKGGGGEKQTSLRLSELNGKPQARGGGGQRPRRTSAAATVMTMGTSGSVVAAAASVRNHDSNGDLEDEEDGEMPLSALRSPKGLSSSAPPASRGGRATLGSIPAGIDIISSAHDAGGGDGDDDRTVGDQSNCSDLSGLTGLKTYYAGDSSVNNAARTGGRRGSAGRLEITRPAQQGRRRSSLCRIPDGITMVHIQELEGEDLDMSSSEFNMSLESLGRKGNGSLESLGAHVGKLTIEEGKKETESASEEESSTTDGSEATEIRGNAEASTKPSSVVSSLLTMDHRLHAQRAWERQDVFQNDAEDPRLAPPAFPALADFVATLSSSKTSAPVSVDPVTTEPSPRSPPPLEQEEVRATPPRSSKSVLDELLQPSRARSNAAAPKEGPIKTNSSLSSALDRIQGTGGGGDGPSALDRLLGGETKKPGTSALDRLLGPAPSGASSRPWELKTPASRPSSGTGHGAAVATSAIDRILGSRPSVHGRLQWGEPRRPGAAGAAPGLERPMGGLSSALGGGRVLVDATSPPRSLQLAEMSSAARSKKARHSK